MRWVLLAVAAAALAGCGSHAATPESVVRAWSQALNADDNKRAADLFTRFLASIVYTGVAPGSFYEGSSDVREHHFDGLPGDFVARVITGVASRVKER